MDQPIVVYDEDCVMCCFFRRWFQRLCRPKNSVEWRHYMQAAACGLNEKACGQALYVQLPNKEVLRGFYAVRCLCAYTWLFWLTPLLYIPGVSWMGEKVYVWVANHRYRMFGTKRRDP